VTEEADRAPRDHFETGDLIWSNPGVGIIKDEPLLVLSVNDDYLRIMSKNGRIWGDSINVRPSQWLKLFRVHFVREGLLVRCVSE
jgi:hypothetical protein